MLNVIVIVLAPVIAFGAPPPRASATPPAVASLDDGGDNAVRTVFHVAVCATWHDFPHEALWRKGMEGTDSTVIAMTSGHRNAGG